MSEKQLQDDKPPGKRRHRRSEINLALFLFQRSYQGQHQDLSDIICSEKIKKDKKWLGLNARDAQGMPILINCVKGSSQKDDETDHLECIKILASTGVVNINMKDVHGRTALHWAIMLKKMEICKYLLKQGAQLDVFDDTQLMTPMHLAIDMGSITFVELICSLCPLEILEAVDSAGRSPLFHAVIIDSTPIFEKLLIAGADPNSLTDGGKYLVSYIIENDLHDFLEVLLKFQVNIYPYGSNKVNVIHMAARKKDAKCLEIIASSYCSDDDLQSVDHNGCTPLMYAVQYDVNENVQFLLTSNVDSNLLDNNGKSALHYTSSNSKTCCLDTLLHFNYDLLNQCDNFQQAPLHDAIIANNAIIVRRLLENGADKNLVDGEGHDLVHYTTGYSAVDCLDELISEGLSVNIHDEHGVYPIHYAVRLHHDKEHERFLKRLDYLKKFIDLPGVDLNVYDNDGLQPIHWAISMGFDAAVKELLIKKVSANTPTLEEKYTPLHLACRSSQLECLQLLLQLPDVEINQVEARGCTPLMFSCSLPDSKFTELLLKAGADPNHIADDGKTPSHIAANNESSVDCLWLLSLKGADLDMKDNNGQTPLQVACLNPNEACLKFLLSRKCDVNATQSSGVSSLHLAVEIKSAEKTQLLLQNDANCNAILYAEEETLTPLDIALENNDYKCIKLLQKFEARTSHSVLNNAASIIQRMWRGYVERNINEKNLCTLSNVSERKISSQSNISVKSSIVHEVVDMNDRNCQVNNLFTYCSNGPIRSMDDKVFSNGFDMSDKEYKEKIDKGNEDIQKMKELMKTAEEMLTRAKHMNKNADSMINSETFQVMRKTNREYIDEKYKRQVNIQNCDVT